jgi:drug/metabolite transporter (DMT)-like permease
MEGLLSYGFTKYLLLSVLIGAPIPFLKNEILKDLSVIEFGLIVNLLLGCMFFFFYFVYEKKNPEELLKTLKTLKTKKIKIFLIFMILMFIGLLVRGTILKKEESVIRYKSYQRPLSTAMMLIVGVYLFNEKISLNMCLGVGVTALGLYLIEKR